MTELFVCYSSHRPETLDLCLEQMKRFDYVVLEEPPSDEFSQVINGSMPIDEYLQALDLEYPQFSSGQYKQLQYLHSLGKTILQVEPYLERLLAIQYFLADNHRPEELKSDAAAYPVYQAEKTATGHLIEYYQQVKTNDFRNILSAMNSFAHADASRFILRDTLRASSIIDSLEGRQNVYIEAGSMHLLLYRLLNQKSNNRWRISYFSADNMALRLNNIKSTLYSPGDRLTFLYIFNRVPRKEIWLRLCAQALIFSKITIKEEITPTPANLFPHALLEYEAISLVNNLSLPTCQFLYSQIRTLTTEEARTYVKRYLNKHHSGEPLAKG